MGKTRNFFIIRRLYLKVTMKTMIYSKILRIIAYFNMVAATFLTIYGTVYPKKIEGGTLTNDLGIAFVMFALHLMLVLAGIFYFLHRRNADRLFSFGKKDVTFLAIAGGNLIYRLFFCKHADTENSLYVAGDTVMAGVAIALMVNLIIVTITTNHLQIKQS